MSNIHFWIGIRYDQGLKSCSVMRVKDSDSVVNINLVLNHFSLAPAAASVSHSSGHLGSFQPSHWSQFCFSHSVAFGCLEEENWKGWEISVESSRHNNSNSFCTLCISLGFWHILCKAPPSCFLRRINRLNIKKNRIQVKLWYYIQKSIWGTTHRCTQTLFWKS